MKGIDRALAFLFVVSLAGCDAELLVEGPVRVCQEVATQCQLEAGPLGVCERRVCRAGEVEPCFECTPQH